MTTPELEQWLSEMETLCAQATPGPWVLWDSCSWRRFGSEATGMTVIEPCHYSADDPHPDLYFRNREGDPPFAAAARDALPQALRLLRSLHEENQRLRDLLIGSGQHAGDCNVWKCDCPGAEINDEHIWWGIRQNFYAHCLRYWHPEIAPPRKVPCPNCDECTVCGGDRVVDEGSDESVEVDVDLDGVDLIAEERGRQIDEEGYTPEHDDAHDDDSLIDAAIYYADRTGAVLRWPWDPASRAKADAMTTPRRLVIAGALIAAELDRRLRQGWQPDASVKKDETP